MERIPHLVDRVYLAMKASAVGAGGPGTVQVGDPQVALPAAVGQVGPEPQHEVGDDLVGVVRVVGAPLGLRYGLAAGDVHVEDPLGPAGPQDGGAHRGAVVEQPVPLAAPAFAKRSVVGVAQRDLEVGDVRHEHLAEPHVPKVQVERRADFARACRKVRCEPRCGEPALNPSALAVLGAHPAIDSHGCRVASLVIGAMRGYMLPVAHLNPLDMIQAR